MVKPGGQGASSSKNFARSLFSKPFKWIYELVNIRTRERIATIPGVLPFYRRTLKPLLIPAPTEQGVVTVSFPDFTLEIDPKDVMGDMALGKAWEPSTSYVFRQVVRPDDVVIDIGAHWGYFTLLASTLCTESGKVYAFEPHPDNFSLLTRNIERNHRSNVVAVQRAVSDREGAALLFDGGASMGHSLKPTLASSGQGDSGHAPISVSSVTLDDYFAGDSVQPRLIKMDIEGAEPNALEGMQGLIKRSPQVVLITEFNPGTLDLTTSANFLKAVTALGFDIAIIDYYRDQLELASPEETLKRLQQPETWTLVNLLCTRGPEVPERLFGTARLEGGETRVVKGLWSE